MSKYQTLVNILDQLRLEAPPAYKSYHPLKSDISKLDQARCKAFIHLFLKVRFGLLEFGEREPFFTEGGNDGGIDAYYIDREAKTIFVVQSKFRTNKKNFEAKEIELKEIFKIQIDRISEGETKDEDGNKYNDKIQAMLKKIQAIPDTANYKWQVVLLANLKKIKQSDLERYTGGFETEVFDFERTYQKLVFPVVNGTFYNVADLFITLQLTNKERNKSTIKYPVKTERASCEIDMIFVPTIEIGKVLHKYKNSMLNYNPRNYLDLKKNPVNKEIESTITDKTSNEFALFNNGITILSDETKITPKTGKKGIGQLYIKKPQIINGGQTAFTLSRIYEDFVASGKRPNVFQDKEVMLKVITVPPGKVDEAEKLLLIEAISKATNQQTTVTEADRRSNDKAQIELQINMFSTFGYFYERKRGEFLDGLKWKYIDRSKIIDRQIALRICCAQKGLASEARRQSAKKFFEKAEFQKLLDGNVDHQVIFYGYKCFKYLGEIEKTFSGSKNRFGVANFGQGLRYGKYAIVSVVIKTHNGGIATADYPQRAKDETDRILAKWLEFESYAMKQKHNGSYFQKTGRGKYVIDFDGYYKGSTLNQDLKIFKF
jgi:hypothetical protein